jgi:hypothetical protein
VLDAFSEHGAFLKQGGSEQLAMFLKIFDCEQLIHGHTPISNITKEMATEAYVYADGRCINVDGGLYLGGPGFVYKLS